MKKFNLTEWSLKHKALIYFFIMLVFILGVYSYQTVGRMEDPDFAIRQMVVSVAWPGASAKQVEEQITDKLEKKLQDTTGLDNLQSYSNPGQSVIFVTLKVDVTEEDLQSTWFDVRNMVNDIKDTLPEGVYGPYFNDKWSDVYGCVYAITSDGFTYEEMRTEAERIRRILLDQDNVKKVQLIGVQPEKIYIEMESSKLSKLGIDPNSLIGTLKAQNAMTPAGMIETSSDNVYLRVSGMFESIENIRNLPVPTTSGSLHLGDIAAVKRDYVDPPEPKMYLNGQPAIGLALSMEEGGNILTLGRSLDKTINKIRKDLPVGLNLEQVANQPKVVKDSINEFVITLLIAIAVVLLVCFLSLGMRTGIVVAFCIPLVIAGVMVGMKMTGIDLHRISLGALIIALGLLVDDEIIAVEMMTVKLEQGWSRSAAAAHAFSSTAGPRLTGALVTCAGFIPIGLSKGIAAEYVGSLFWVVTMALLTSWIVAGTATPLLGYNLIKVKPHHNEQGFDLYNTKFYLLFRRILTWCLEHRKLVLISVGAAFILSVFLFLGLKQDFFPTGLRPELIVDLRLPEGASIQATESEANRLSKCLKGDPNIVNCIYYVGTGSPRFVLTLEPTLPSTNFAQFVIVAKDVEAREKLEQKVNTLLAQQFPSVRGHCRVIQYGPPTKYPVTLRIMGYNHDKVREIAGQVQTIMESKSYLRDINLNWNEKNKIIHLEIDQDKARILGVNSQTLSQILQSQLSGVSITDFREKDKTASIVFRMDENSRTDLSEVKNLVIPLSSGQYVPLEQVAKISFDNEEGLIWRRDLKPTITVQAEVANEDITGNDATKQVYDSLKELRDSLPSGYSIELDGVAENSNLAMNYLMEMVPAMIVIIILLIMIQLESIPKTILTLLTAPLGLIGVSPALFLTHNPVCFVVEFGLLALGGIIIRNSLILIDQIDQQLMAGESPWDAIINSAVQRFRPIMLTAVAAILGMIPLTTSPFWGPMAVAIAGGLLVATVLTLLVLPVMYAAWCKASPHIEPTNTGEEMSF